MHQRCCIGTIIHGDVNAAEIDTLLGQFKRRMMEDATHRQHPPRPRSHFPLPTTRTPADTARSRKALGEMAPQRRHRTRSRSPNCVGRGGAGFPTACKWSLVPHRDAAPAPRYLVVNADEMEPGTFKDRLLLGGDPHQMIEAVIIAVLCDLSRYRLYLFARRIFLPGRTAPTTGDQRSQCAWLSRYKYLRLRISTSQRMFIPAAAVTSVAKRPHC